MLVRAVGVAAFSLVMPLTIAVIAVLLFVTLSYLEVVKVYTKAAAPMSCPARSRASRWRKWQSCRCSSITP